MTADAQAMADECVLIREDGLRAPRQTCDEPRALASAPAGERRADGGPRTGQCPRRYRRFPGRGSHGRWTNRYLRPRARPLRGAGEALGWERSGSGGRQIGRLYRHLALFGAITLVRNP